MSEIAYDKLGTFLYKLILDHGQEFYFDTYAVSLSYSHDGKDWSKSREVFEIDVAEGSVCWFNDWWEGQSYIRLNGFMNIDVLFHLGFRRYIEKEFTDEDIDQDTV